MKFSWITNLCIALAVAALFTGSPSVYAVTGPYCGKDSTGCTPQPTGNSETGTKATQSGQECSDEGNHSEGSTAHCYCSSTSMSGNTTGDHANENYVCNCEPGTGQTAKKEDGSDDCWYVPKPKPKVRAKADKEIDIIKDLF